MEGLSALEGICPPAFLGRSGELFPKPGRLGKVSRKLAIAPRKVAFKVISLEEVKDKTEEGHRPRPVQPLCPSKCGLLWRARGRPHLDLLQLRA